MEGAKTLVVITAAHSQPSSSGLARRTAFTLVETVMAVAILSIFVTFAYAAMLISNRQAMVSRLYTLAEEMARNQVDRIEAVGPYNPQFATPQIPTELTLGTATATLPLYTDPNTGNVVINATMTTAVSDTGTLDTRAAQITVAYTFSGRSYTVKMNTLRTSDS